jgi:prepilin-type processing-associated H-X9-DG protein
MRTSPSLNKLASTPRQGASPGFTRLELLIILGVLLVVGAIHLHGVGHAAWKSAELRCQSNLQQLMVGWFQYFHDHDGKLAPNSDGGATNTWVRGWLDFSTSNSDNTNTLYLTDPRYAALGPYVHEASAYHCPEDQSTYRRILPRVRSYSMSNYMGYLGTTIYSPGFRIFRRYSDFTGLSPHEAFVLIDEREDSINDSTLLINMGGYQNPAAAYIVDYPADWHNRGANLTFADGHAEYWRWEDARTMPAHRRNTTLTLNMPSPNNEDVLRLIHHTSEPQ